MKYPPPHHQEESKTHLLDVIKSYPLAILISVKDEQPFVTHLPLIYSEGKLIGHIDKFNPQAALLSNHRPVTVLFTGPQCYISPSIYSTSQLPTWNYVNVHLKGVVTAIEDPERVKQSIVDMTAQLESPEQKYQLSKENPRMDALIEYIKGFEIEITSWEGKFKLSQDKNPKDIRKAKEELIRSNQQSIKAFLERIFPT